MGRTNFSGPVVSPGGFEGPIVTPAGAPAAALGTGATIANPITVTGLPTADPGIPGRLWIDTAAGRVLKVSA
jgi:hypothetical protein